MGSEEGGESKWQLLEFQALITHQSSHPPIAQSTELQALSDEAGLSPLPWMTVCLKSSSRRWGRKQSMRSQVISQRAEGLPPRASALWKISAVSITRSMFFRDSGMASDYRW